MGSLSVSVRQSIPCSGRGSLSVCCIFIVCIRAVHTVVLSCNGTDIQSQTGFSCCDLWPSYTNWYLSSCLVGELLYPRN